MRVLQACFLFATCVIIRAGYINPREGYGYYPREGYGYYPREGYGYYPREGYGYYPRYVTYATAYKDYSGEVQGEKYAYPQYNYNYAVNDPHTGDHKTAWEVRDGDVVKGAYSFAEADGTTRIVEYTADKHHGFNAVVKRVGQAYHPQVYQKQYENVRYYGYH